METGGIMDYAEKSLAKTRRIRSVAAYQTEESP